MSCTLLYISSSPLGSASLSRQLTEEFVQSWKRANPSGGMIERDLTATDISPVSAAWISASRTAADLRTKAQREILTASDALIGELRAADEYVFGVPMHNFGVPSVLKLWIDQVARVNETFSYATGTPVGLLTGKKATLVISSGGVYTAGTAMAAYDFVEPYLRTVLGFLGVKEVTTVHAGGASALASGKIGAQEFLQPHYDAIHAQFNA
jgi:FMN-dependent NADH-azoreductase